MHIKLRNLLRVRSCSVRVLSTCEESRTTSRVTEFFLSLALAMLTKAVVSERQGNHHQINAAKRGTPEHKLR